MVQSQFYPARMVLWPHGGGIARRRGGRMPPGMGSWQPWKATPRCCDEVPRKNNRRAPAPITGAQIVAAPPAQGFEVACPDDPIGCSLACAGEGFAWHCAGCDAGYYYREYVMW